MTRYHAIQTRAEHYLHLWAAWMRNRTPENGYPPKSIGFFCGGSVSSLEDLVEQCEDDAVRIVDGLVNSLPLIQQASILNVWGLQKVWRSNRRSLDDVYQEALGAIESGLNKWGLP